MPGVVSEGADVHAACAAIADAIELYASVRVSVGDIAAEVVTALRRRYHPWPQQYLDLALAGAGYQRGPMHRGHRLYVREGGARLVIPARPCIRSATHATILNAARLPSGALSARPRTTAEAADLMVRALVQGYEHAVYEMDLLQRHSTKPIPPPDWTRSADYAALSEHCAAQMDSGSFGVVHDEDIVDDVIEGDVAPRVLLGSRLRVRGGALVALVSGMAVFLDGAARNLGPQRPRARALSDLMRLELLEAWDVRLGLGAPTGEIEMAVVMGLDLAGALAWRQRLLCEPM